MGFFEDLKILYHMAFKPIQGENHQERLESFYAGQAEGYDDFRKRLLQGRQELWDALAQVVWESPAMPLPDGGGVWVDMGAGTGSNLHYFGDHLPKLKKIYLVDLSPSLLKMADKRIAEKGWTNCETIEADATKWQPPGGQLADVVTFSYSLTMIPDWFAAIDNAMRMLKPGGLLGVVDFYVSRKYAAEGHAQHGWFTRTFWPTWFNSDNVFPSPDHPPYLQHKFEQVLFDEREASIPYMYFVATPYYRFIGRKKLIAE